MKGLSSKVKPTKQIKRLKAEGTHVLITLMSSIKKIEGCFHFIAK
jgi:hypothetical protein